MDWANSIIVPIAVAAVSAFATVMVTDFIGLRRDRARLRMELHWQIQRQSWDALYGALQACPLFSPHDHEKLQSIRDVASWSETQVEPWLGKPEAEKLSELRARVEAWLITVVASARQKPGIPIPIPGETIMEIRQFALASITEALAEIRDRNSKLTNQSKL